MASSTSDAAWLVISKTSTVEDVCAWATRAANEGGVGLSDENVGILRLQEIDGETLFSVTEAELEKILCALGPRKKLLTAIDRIREPPATSPSAPDFSQALEGVLASQSCQSPRPSRRRGSIESTDVLIDWRNPGKRFAFVNREAQCHELLQSVIALEVIRSSDILIDRWETLRRDARVPLVAAMPGVGKTTFARKAVDHLAQLASSSCELTPMLEAVTTFAPGREGLARSLLRASFEDRCLRIDLSDPFYASAFDRRKTSAVAVGLLAEWCKHRAGERADVLRDIVRATLLGGNVTLEEAARYILRAATLPTTTTSQSISVAASQETVGAGSGRPDVLSDDAPSILVTLDEAHVLQAGALGVLLRAFLHLAVERRLRVFVVVCGVTEKRMLAEFSGSQVQPCVIGLPLLSQLHMAEIASTLLPGTEWGPSNLVLWHALWWLGGVPRYLEWFLCEAARRANGKVMLSDSAPVEEYLSRLQLADSARLVDGVAARLLPQLDAGFGSASHGSVSSGVIGAAFSLALINAPVYDTVVLGGGASCAGMTVAEAQEQSLLYLDKSVREDRRGTIQIPPMVLYWMHRRAHEAAREVYLFSHFSPYMSSRDNEAVAILVLMHKLYAASMLGSTTSLSALGIPVEPSNDMLFGIPPCFSVVRTEGNVTAANFSALEAATRTAMREGRCDTVAFVNGPTAPFGDSFMILPDVNIFFQEKQRVTARLASAFASSMSAVGSTEALAAPGRFSSSDVMAEYKKLGIARKHPHVFLYLTDDDPSLGLELKHPVYAFPPARHPALLGDACAYLRRMALSWSSVDLASSAVAQVHSGAKAARVALAAAEAIASDSAIGDKRRRDGSSASALAESAGGSGAS